MARSLFSRPVDIVFILFFLSHIPATLFVDGQSLFGQAIFPQPVQDAVQQWVDMSGDPWLAKVVEGKPVDIWFRAILAGEFFFQLPAFFYLAAGFWNDRAAIRIPAIVYSAHVCTTMIPILSEIVLGHPEIPAEKRQILLAAYLPYLLVPFCLLVRMTLGFNKWRRGSADSVPVLKKRV
ncbi:Transmembrane protein 97 [Borealophlyctis nickersoniae]|nr:Transmembrane protein 97 [Borealophlyctis nickersoniae]